jgi:hypothetical protein
MELFGEQLSESLHRAILYVEKEVSDEHVVSIFRVELLDQQHSVTSGTLKFQQHRC